MMKRLAVALAAFCLCASAFAQQIPPFTYPQTLGTSSVTVLPVNPARKKVIFHNPNATALIAVCPVGPSRAVPFSPTLIVAAINGAGCLTLLPSQTQEISGSTASGPQQSMGSAWVGVASAAGSSFTALEFEEGELEHVEINEVMAAASQVSATSAQPAAAEQACTVERGRCACGKSCEQQGRH